MSSFPLAQLWNILPCAFQDYTKDTRSFRFMEKKAEKDSPYLMLSRKAKKAFCFALMSWQEVRFFSRFVSDDSLLVRKSGQNVRILES